VHFHPPEQRGAVAESMGSCSKVSKPVVESRKRSLEIAHKVLVPIDGSERSLRALSHLIRTVGTTALEVHVVNVQRLVMQGDFALNVAVRMEVRARLAAAEQILERARMRLDATGIPFRTSVLFGDPARAIARYATEHGFDAIVMGTRGPSTESGVPRGSVASKVVSLTAVPVTLVKSARARLTEAPSGAVRC
jgi:nucleotide-binding universal stress UspA family protein